MADKLLSQSDVDALVSSLTSNREAKKAPPASSPVNSASPSTNSLPTTKTASPSSGNIPTTKTASALSGSMSASKISSPSSASMTAIKPASQSSNTLPLNKAAGSSMVKTPLIVSQNAASRSALPARPELKPQMPSGVEKLGAIEAKLTNLNKRLEQLGTLVSRIELMEKRLTAVESELIRERENTVVNKQIQTLAEELKRISVNLQNTPGYGIRRQFKCEKCDDQGSVATMFRCTKCGHESWRGWWPQK